MSWLVLLLLMFQDGPFLSAPILEGHSSEYCNITRFHAPAECKLILYLDDGIESTAIKTLLNTDYSEYRKHELKGTREYKQANLYMDEINAACRITTIVVKHETDTDIRRDIQFPAFGFNLRGDWWPFHNIKSYDPYLIAAELHHIAKLRQIVYNIVQNGTEWKKQAFELKDGVPILVWVESESYRKQDDWDVHTKQRDLTTRGPLGPPRFVSTKSITQTWTRTVTNELGLQERQELTKEYTIPGNTPISTLILYTDHGTGQLLDYYVSQLIKEGIFQRPPIIIP